MEIEFKTNKFHIIKGETHPEYSIFTFTSEELDFRNKYWDIKNNDIVFDVGSSYGAYALTACSMGATVFCFEPETTVYKDLVKNIAINHWQDKCTAYNIALWSNPTIVDMKSYAPHWPAQTITSNYKTDALDNIVKNNNISKLDWIKIDVEGSEEQVLLGAKESISQFMPSMIIECHNFLDNQISNRIRGLLNYISPNYSIEEVKRDPCVMLIAKAKGKS